MGSSRLRRAGVNEVTGQRHRVTTKATQGDSTCLHPKKGSPPRGAFNILSQPILNETEKVLACVEHRPTSEILRAQPRPPKRSEHRNRVEAFPLVEKGVSLQFLKNATPVKHKDTRSARVYQVTSGASFRGVQAAQTQGPALRRTPVGIHALRSLSSES